MDVGCDVGSGVEVARGDLVGARVTTVGCNVVGEGVGSGVGMMLVGLGLGGEELEQPEVKETSLTT